MDVIGLIISTIVFIMSARYFYEIWFLPDKFVARIQDYRKSLRNFLGFSYWQEGRINFAIVKPVSIFVLIISLLGIIFSITGPITINAR